MTALQIGSPALPFRLTGVDGKTYALEDFGASPALVVLFSCNHCPYVQAYEDRLVAVQRDYAARGVAMVAINSNDARKYPDDSFPEMVKRAKAKGYNFPYLHDATQAVATAYGAVRTPEAFVFDAARRLRYHGAIDDNWQEPAQVKTRFLREALDAVLAGHAPPTADVYPVGCTIKWAPRP